MKFDIGDKVRILKIKPGIKRFMIDAIGTVKYREWDDGTFYKVCIGDIGFWYGENELELVEDKKDEEKQPTKIQPKRLVGKVGMMLFCERCKKEEFVEFTNIGEVELVADLELNTDISDRWGETVGGLFLCPECVDEYQNMFKKFLLMGEEDKASSEVIVSEIEEEPKKKYVSHWC